MKRNRIVINVDNLPPRRRGGSSGCAKVAIVAVLVLLILLGAGGAGGYFWWRHYQTTPAYALAVLADAAQRNDSATVDSILDSEKIATDFIDQVRKQFPGSSTLAQILPSDSEPLKSISAKLKDTVHDQLLLELQDLTDVAKNKPFVLVALAVPRYVDIKQEDKTANATVNLKGESIKLTMQADGNQWRVTSVQDEKLVKLVADAVVHNAPSNLIELQDEIKKQLEQLMK